MTHLNKLAISILVLPQVVNAGGYTGKAEISRFSSMGSTGSFEVYGTWENPDDCSNNSKYIVGNHPDDTEQTRSAKFSMIMAAYLAGKSVEFYVSGCSSSGQPIVKNIYLPGRN